MATLYTQQSKNITKTWILVVLIFVFSFLFISQNVFAKDPSEKIGNFFAQIRIKEDGSMSVFEHIIYDFGNTERHGIFRDIPVEYKTKVGNKSIALKVKNITRDGYVEDFQISNSGFNKNIKIGSPDMMLNGEHVYIIEYEVKGAINYFTDFDELYWNVTGNDWIVDIENSSVFIELPKNLDSKDLKLSCYRGALGSNQNCSIKIENNKIVANTEILQQGEGFTVAIGFPKGIVHEMSIFEKVISFLKDNGIVLLPIVVFIFMYFLWRRSGKDPIGFSTIMAEYEPPMNMKPSLVGSMVDEKPDSRDITAGLIYLAEQGYITITRIEKQGWFDSVNYEFELMKSDVSGLEKIEQNILFLFFGSFVVGTKKKLSDFKRDISFSQQIQKMLKDLYQEMADKGFFEKNPQKAKGLYVSIAMLFGVGANFLIPILFGPNPLAIGSCILSGIIIFGFGMLMSKKTKLGAETKDKILGFKLFLSMTDKERFDFHNAPQKNPEQFMKFLPYAIALGVEKKWAKQFEGIYISQPNWYHSNVAGAFLAVNFMDHMSSLSQSTSHVFVPPSQSASRGFSGSGGRGFSGGGFGGGGGGSW